MPHSGDNRRHHAPTPHRQRGAVAVFVAAGLVALVASLLLVLDIGRLYYAQRQLQLDANMAALAGAQAGSGCLSNSNGVPGNADAITTAVLQSLQNNTPGLGTTGGSTSSIAYLGVPTEHGTTSDVEDGTSFSAIDLKGTGDNVLKYAVRAGRVTVGTSTAGSRVNTFEALPLQSTDAEGNTGANPNVDSVQVTLATQAPSSFLTHFFGDNAAPKTLYASATAKQQALGSFSLGSQLTTLNTADSPLLQPLLSGLLGTTVDANVLSAAGAAQVSLSALETAASKLGLGVDVNNLHDLANLQTNLTDAVKILGGAVSGTAGGAISGLAGSVYNNDGGPTRNYFGDLFSGVTSNFNPAVDSAASQIPFVNALELLTALGQDAAVGQGPIALQPGSDFLGLLKIPGLASLQTFVTITEPPSLAPLLPADPFFYEDPEHRATAKTAQAVISVRLAVNVLSLIKLNLGLDAQVAPARASLTKLVCPSASDSGHIEAKVGVQTDVAELSVGAFDPNQTNPPLGSGKLVDVLPVDLGLIKIEVLSASVANDKIGPVPVGSKEPKSTEPPFQNYIPLDSSAGLTAYKAVPPDSQAVGTTGLLEPAVSGLVSDLTDNGNLQFTLLKICLPICLNIGNILGLNNVVDSLVSAIGDLLDPITSALDKILAQLTQLLGLQLGTATVTMGHVVLGQPVIVTNCLPDVAGANGCPPLP